MNQVSRLIEHVNFKDLIDILIVSVVIYNILLIIKGTRAVQILIGLFAVVVLFWLSHQYKLYSLNWILGNFFESFFIIFIIIFQEQIRSALAFFGNTKMLRNIKKQDVDQALEEVIELVGVLKKEKIGALIVFERQNGLLNYRNTGTILDCKIHTDILYSIFQTNSPLHDGAVIIQGDRITAAGCFLPLSKNVEIDRHLGTRHRAAMGITEVSDAIVVIVSEETGKINICFNGVFYLMDNQSALRRKLKAMMSMPTNTKNFLKEPTKV